MNTGIGLYFTNYTFITTKTNLVVQKVDCQRGENQGLKNFNGCFEIIVGEIIVKSPYIYIYIYIERERERDIEREI